MLTCCCHFMFCYECTVMYRTHHKEAFILHIEWLWVQEVWRENPSSPLRAVTSHQLYTSSWCPMRG